MQDLINFDTPKPENKTIVKIIRNCYQNSKKDFILQTKISVLKRKSYGYQLILDDCDNTSCEEVIRRIVNLSIVKDGIYELKTINITHDFETGHIDNWDYELLLTNLENIK